MIQRAFSRAGATKFCMALRCALSLLDRYTYVYIRLKAASLQIFSRPHRRTSRDLLRHVLWPPAVPELVKFCVVEAVEGQTDVRLSFLPTCRPLSQRSPQQPNSEQTTTTKHIHRQPCQQHSDRLPALRSSQWSLVKLQQGQATAITTCACHR